MKFRDLSGKEFGNLVAISCDLSRTRTGGHSGVQLMWLVKVKGIRIKGNKIKLSPVYRDASAAIRAKKSKRQKVVRRTV